MISKTAKRPFQTSTDFGTPAIRAGSVRPREKLSSYQDSASTASFVSYLKEESAAKILYQGSGTNTQADTANTLDATLGNLILKVH